MDSQTNTDGGAAIQGDANVQGNLIGRDQINYIFVVGNLLHFAGIEGILPKITHPESFGSLIEAVESALGNHLNSDLTEATAFAGIILGDFISTQLTCNPHEPISLKTFVANLVKYIAIRLKKTGYWGAYSQSVYDYSDVVLLETTIIFWNKQFPRNKKKEIFISLSRYAYELYVERDANIARFNTKELRVLIAGIVLDLIRIGLDASFNNQFLKSMAEQFSPDQK